MREPPRRHSAGSTLLTAPAADVDERTRRLYDEVSSRPRNRDLARVLDSVTPTSPLPDVRLVLVPGLFYRERPRSGADGAFLAAVARDFGLGMETIPVDGSAGLDGGADAINDWLIHSADARPILLFTLSMGTNEVRHALTRANAARAFEHVRAWTSISGLPFGSAAVDLTLANPLRRLFVRALCRFKGWHFENLRDVVRHRPGAPFPLPAHVRFVQVAAFPEHANLRDRRSRRLHRWLASYGPNDGFVLLDELANLPGELYPVRGADHYLNGAASLEGRLAALLSELAIRTS